MRQNELHEKTVKKNQIFKGKAVGFSVDTVRLINGKTATREYLNHPGAVAVIPFVNSRNIVLVEQYRYPVGEAVLELPAGKIDVGEKPLKCVRRELLEETGYHAGRVRKIGAFWPTAAFSNEIIYLYTAHDLTYRQQSLDEDEFLHTHILPLSKVRDMILNRKIKDSKTIIAILMYLQMR